MCTVSFGCYHGSLYPRKRLCFRSILRGQKYCCGSCGGPRKDIRGDFDAGQCGSSDAIGLEYELVELRNGQNIDSRAYEDLQQMMDDARAEGLDPYICSSWRSHETQEQLFEEEIADYVEKGYSESEARVRAAEWVAVPGTSEHELGLALDIVSEENQRLEEAQKDTPTQQWLMAHCYEYGFILRYPKDKEDITGISYEPWHYRYVGREDAAAIRDLGVCLEEYLEQK